MNNFSRDTSTGKLFELRAKGHAPGIPLHKKEFGKYVEKQTGKYYSLTRIRPSKKKKFLKVRVNEQKCLKDNISYLEL